MAREYRFNGNINNIQEAVMFLIDIGELDKKRVGFSNSDKKEIIDTSCNPFARITFQSQVDKSVFVRVANDFKAWDIISKHLRRLGWVVEQIPSNLYVTTFHPYVDPAKIKKNKHKKIVGLLIDRYLGRVKMTNDEIAKVANISKSQFYVIKKKYTTSLTQNT